MTDVQKVTHRPGQRSDVVKIIDHYQQRTNHLKVTVVGKRADHD